MASSDYNKNDRLNNDVGQQGQAQLNRSRAVRDGICKSKMLELKNILHNTDNNGCDNDVSENFSRQHNPWCFRELIAHLCSFNDRANVRCP